MKPLAIASIIGALVMLGVTAHAIKTSRARLQIGADDRKRNCLAFWFDIVFNLLLAGGFAFLAAREILR